MGRIDRSRFERDNQKAPIDSKETMVKEASGDWHNGAIREAKKVTKKAESD